MPDSPLNTVAPVSPKSSNDLSGLPSPPDLTVRDDNPLDDETKKAPPASPYPTVYPLSAEALAQRVQAWVMNPHEPFDKLNRIPLVDLPPENIGYQSPFLPYKGAVLKPPM